MGNAVFAPVPYYKKNAKIISFEDLKSAADEREKKEKSKRDYLNNNAGKDTEVYAFRTEEEISAMISVFDKHIEEAENDNQFKIARRNKMLFIVGINIGIRGSDLRTLQWSFFFDEQSDGTLKFRPFYTLMPMKQRKQKKYVKLFFNDAVVKTVSDYVAEFPISDLNDYLFASRKGDEPINVRSLWRIIKEAAKEAGIEQNIGSHSLRKTFGYWAWHKANEQGQGDKALVILQNIFNHSSTLVTQKYIGIRDDEQEDMFHSLNLGL